MPRNPYYESDNPSTVVRGATWRGGIWVLAVVLIAFAIGAVILVINTIAASPRGQAQAYQQKESANNRVFAQQYFEQTSAEIIATKAKINRAGLVLNPTEKQQANLEGLQSYCSTIVGQYNAAGRSYTTQQFKAADLPATWDPTTDCEPTK